MNKEIVIEFRVFHRLTLDYKVDLLARFEKRLVFSCLAFSGGPKSVKILFVNRREHRLYCFTWFGLKYYGRDLNRASRDVHPNRAENHAQLVDRDCRNNIVNHIEPFSRGTLANKFERFSLTPWFPLTLISMI